MKVMVGRWGNSLAVRLPKDIAEQFRLEEGSEIDSDVLVEAFSVDRERRRDEAAARIREMRLPLPADYKFDREEANAR